MIESDTASAVAAAGSESELRVESRTRMPVPAPHWQDDIGFIENLVSLLPCSPTTGSLTFFSHSAG